MTTKVKTADIDTSREWFQEMYDVQAGKKPDFATIEDPAETDKAEAAKPLDGILAALSSQEMLDKMNGISPAERKVLNAKEAEAAVLNDYVSTYDAPAAEAYRLQQVAAAVSHSGNYTPEDLSDPTRRREFVAQVGLVMGAKRRTAGKAKAVAEKDRPSRLAAEMAAALDGGEAPAEQGDGEATRYGNEMEAQNAAWLRQLGDERWKLGLR